MFQCGGCNVATYCSKKCQQENWSQVHATICAHLKKRRKVDGNPGIDVLRNLIENNATEDIVHIAQILSVEDVANMLLSGQAEFLRDNSTGTNLFWYTRANIKEPFDSDNNYRQIYERQIALESITYEHNGQHLFEHPTMGEFSVSPFDTAEFDGAHLTMFNTIGMPPNPEANVIFQQIVDQFRRRNVRESFVEMGMVPRAGFYLNVPDIMWLFQYLFDNGFVLKRRR